MRSPDRFEASQGVYLAEWVEPEYVSFEVDLIRTESRSGDVTAEITVVSTVPGLEALIHKARVTLTGTQSRSTLAKHLGTRGRGVAVDWNGLIETVAVRVLTAYRAGEPAVRLSEVQRPPDAGYLLPPLVLGGHPTIWFGDGGTGKSLLALSAALSIDQGIPLLGLTPSSQRRVGYLDWELSAWDHRQRSEQLLEGQAPDLAYLRCSAPIWEELHRIQRFVRDYGVGFLIIDSVGVACAGIPIETSEAPLRFFQAVRYLGLGALCIAHRTKDRHSGEDYPFGSIFWHNGARATWYVKRESEDEADGSFTVGLFNRKATTTRKQRPLAFHVSAEDDRLSIGRQDVQQTRELVEMLPAWTRIMSALMRRQGEPRTYEELAVELGLKQELVERTVQRRADLFVRLSEAGHVRVSLRARPS